MTQVACREPASESADLDLPGFEKGMLVRLRILLLFLAAIGGTCWAKDRDVILTTDCGTEIDDQYAVTYLMLSPQFHVKGVVTTHAPNLQEKAKTSAECVRDVFGHLQLSSPPPVFPGSDGPLKERKPLSNKGVDFIIRTSRSYSRSNRLLVLTIGATTDVGSAFLQDPTLGERVEILTMGFSSWPKGTDPWNIKNDPLAYQIILESNAPIAIGGTDVCRAHLTLDDKASDHMLRAHGPVGDWLNGLFQDWVTKNADFVARDVGPHQWVIWDTIVIGHMLGYTRAETHPRPNLNQHDLTFELAPSKKTLRWITDLDEKRMWADFVRKIEQAGTAPRVKAN